MNKHIMIVACLIVITWSAAATKAQARESSAQTGSEVDKIYRLSEVDEKPQIKKKPRPGIENSYGSCSGQGVVQLRVVFLKTAQVGDIEVIRPSKCSIFDDNAMRAAKKIKFKPAVKYGQPVSVRMTLQYSYKEF